MTRNNQPGELYLSYIEQSKNPKTKVVIHGSSLLNNFNLEKFLYYLKFLININEKKVWVCASEFLKYDEILYYSVMEDVLLYHIEYSKEECINLCIGLQQNEIDEIIKPMIKACDDIRKRNYFKFIIDNGFTCFKPDEVFTN